MCDRPTYIYALMEPDFVTIRYVGKTVDLSKRYKRHLQPCARGSATHKHNWIASLLRRGDKPIMVELENVPLGGDWASRERYWIAYYRSLGFDLTNATRGGDGQTGLRHTDEARTKMSRAHKGRSKSPETRERIRQARLGKRLSDETKAKISESARRRHIPNALIANTAKGRILSDDHRANISEGLRRYHERRRIEKQASSV